MHLPASLLPGEGVHPKIVSERDSGRVGSGIPLWGMTRQPSLGLGA